MTGFKSGHGNKSGNRFYTDQINNSGYRKIMGIEFKTGCRYVSGKKIKAG